MIYGIGADGGVVLFDWRASVAPHVNVEESGSIRTENRPKLHKRVFAERAFLWFLECLKIKYIHVGFQVIHLGAN